MPVLWAAPAAAILAGIIAAGGCSSSPSCGNMACPPAVAARLGYAITVNGRSASLHWHGQPPGFPARPGQRLHITVAVTVLGHTTVTALSLGISAHSYGGSPQHPIGVQPILAHSRQPLAPGLHTFGLHWRIPNDQPGTSLLLASVWSTDQADIAQAIATLTLN
jgi:hypothetical protein